MDTKNNKVLDLACPYYRHGYSLSCFNMPSEVPLTVAFLDGNGEHRN